jgi:hypothetical protein
MGMYTDIQLTVLLSKSTNKEIIDLIRSPLAHAGWDNWCGDEFSARESIRFPDHPLFKYSRVLFLLGEGGADEFNNRADDPFLSLTRGEGGHWRLSLLNSIKNYNDEIELLLDWLTPYVCSESGKVGEKRYEEFNTPTDILFIDGAFSFKAQPEEDDGAWGFSCH